MDKSERRRACSLAAWFSAVSFAKLEGRQVSDKQGVPFSMASVKRRCFNQHLVDRILDQLATGERLDKSSPIYVTNGVSL